MIRVFKGNVNKIRTNGTRNNRKAFILTDRTSVYCLGVTMVINVCTKRRVGSIPTDPDERAVAYQISDARGGCRCALER